MRYIEKPRSVGKSPVFSMPYAQFAQQLANGQRVMSEIVAEIKTEAEARGHVVTIIDDSIIIEDKK